jgi:hypothetical protein
MELFFCGGKVAQLFRWRNKPLLLEISLQQVRKENLQSMQVQGKKLLLPLMYTSLYYLPAKLPGYDNNNNKRDEYCSRTNQLADSRRKASYYK